MPNWRGLPPMVSPEPLTENDGLTRSTTRAGRPTACASSSTSASSGSDSTMIARTPVLRHETSSSRLLPGPRNRTSCGATPAASAVRSSARDDTSAFAPSACSSPQTLTFGFALSE
ncbi:Uncharacterised protein [Mycobacteroides abscessus]|nr:Uncharacterised protein [Mycobacteroides abscessus]